MSDTVVYLYGFVPADTTLPDAGLVGLGDADVRLLDTAGARAAYSLVPAAEYGPDHVESRLDDLEWVSKQGVRHEQVVAWFVDHVQILPARLFTLFSGTAALEERAAERADEIAANLERFGGLREWDLKVSYRADQLAAAMGALSDEIAALDSRIRDSSPGKRFLLEKKREALARAEVEEAARRTAQTLLEAAAEHAEEVRVVSSPRTEGAPVVLNAALLLPQEAEATVRDAVRSRAGELEALGIDVSYSGPWAPYRFLGESQ